MGDFGAASFLPTNEPETALLLTSLEVRAFGCLLAELLAHCQPQDTPADTLDRLHTLQIHCSSPDVAARPTMAEVEQALRCLAQ